MARQLTAAVANTAFTAGGLARKLWRSPNLAALDFLALLEKGGGLAEGMLRTLAGTAGGFEHILALGSALRDTADGTRRKQYVSMLRYSVDLTLTIVQSALKRDGVLTAVSRRIDNGLATLHLSGGLPVADEGVLAHYRLELLRHNATVSQAFRAVPVYPTIAGRKGKKPVYHYETVRKTNLLEPNLHFPAGKVLHPTDVHEQGFLHDFRLKVTRANANAPKAAAASSASRTTPKTPTAMPGAAAPHSEPPPTPPSTSPSKNTDGRRAGLLDRPRELFRSATSGSITALKSATDSASNASRALASTAAAVAASPAAAFSSVGSSVGAALSGATDIASSALDKAAGAAKGSSGENGGPAASLSRGDPLEQVNRYLEERYKCCAGPIKSWLPPWLKAQIPFEVNDNWLPESLRDHADEVVALDIDVEMSLVFDPDSDSVELEACDDIGSTVAKRMGFGSLATLGASSKEKIKPPPVRFQFQLTGTGCWPTLAQLTVRSVRFHARCKVWWDVFQQKMLLAFIEAAPEAAKDAATDESGASSGSSGQQGNAQSQRKHGHFATDLDLSFFGCGMPLPSDVEARLVSNLVTMAMTAHNRLNPYEIDLAEIESKSSESVAASVVQAAHRGWRDRKASTVEMRSHQYEKETRTLAQQIARLEGQVTELQAELKELRQENRAVINRGYQI